MSACSDAGLMVFPDMVKALSTIDAPAGAPR